MDYTTDAMGNYQGDYGAVDPYAEETEEQRRLRLQREAQAAAQTPAAPVAPAAEKPRPVKQTITTDPRTGQQTMKIEGSVQDLSSANPRTPTVMPPNFDQMLQVESGNRDFDAQGRPIVSPKGARYAAQVMPATARDPGFGVRPAADDSPAESNRVGQDYYQAMLNKYPGQPELARAAYNAGPGAVDAAIQKSMMQGGSPLDYLPKETQGYVQKTAGNVRMEGGNLKVVPPAQQQPAAEPVVTAQQLGSQTFPMTAAPAAPVAPAEPELAPGSGYSLASGQPSTGIQVPGMTSVPLTEGTQLPAAQQRFQEIQDDPGALLAYRNDNAIPESLRRRAGERATELLNTERNLSKAQTRRDELIASGDGKAIANAVQGRGAKGEEGNWLKFVFLQYIDKRMADVEAEKLGLLPSKYEQTTISDENGNTRAVEVKKSAVSGKILEATNMDGTPLTADEMSSLNAMGGKKVHSAQTLIDPDTKKIVTEQVLSDGTMRYMSGGKVYTGNKDALIPEPAYTAQENKKTLATEKSASKKEETQQKAEDRRVEAAIKALEKRIPNPTVQQRQQALVAAGVPADRIEQEMGLAAGSLTGKIPAVPVQEAPVQQTPAAVPAAPGAMPAPAARPAPAPRSETTIGQLGPRPVEPSPVDPGPGESAESAKARNKSAQETYKSELAAWQKQKDRFDKREEELPAKQTLTQDALDLIDRFIKHPGFNDVIGFADNPITGYLDLPLTDQRGARQLFKQIDADTFLQGFDRLRGGGSITVTEGDQAKQAVAALRDINITEAEWKANAKIYTDILKRGINRERQQLGLGPLYPDVADSGSAVGSQTPAQKAAAELERRKKGQ
jgi:hypothetical protein